MKAYLAFLLATITVLTAGAAPFQPSDVPATAKWVLHVDMERLHASQSGALILQEAQRNEQTRASLELARGMLGFDVLKDLSAITTYGSVFGADAGVAVVRGAIKPKTVENILKNAGTHETVIYGKREIHRWSQGKKQGALCVADPQTVIMGNEPDAVRAALDVLDGRTDSLARKKGIGFPAKTGAILALAAEPDKGTNAPIRAAILQNADRLQLVAGETGGNVEANLQVDFSPPATAAQAEQVAKGLLLVAVLSADRNPTLAELAANIHVQTTGDTLTLHLVHPVLKFHEFVKAQRERTRSHTTPRGGASNAPPARAAGNAGN